MPVLILQKANTTTEMKTLTQYTKHGITRRALHRGGNIAIFASERDYEVIIIQSHDGRVIAGKECPAAEYPPSSEQWGAKGWTYRTIDEAIQKYNELYLKHRFPATHESRQARFESAEGEDSQTGATMP
jgi:hypothetical protein